MTSKPSPSSTSTPASEAQFLAGYDAAKFQRPSVAVDLLLLTVEQQVLKVLLLKRTEHPGLGRWALPGGFVGIDESLDAAAGRVLRTKAGVGDVFVEQLYTFGKPGRDARTRVISVAYFALVPVERLRRALGRAEGLPACLAAVVAGDAGLSQNPGPVAACDDAGRPLPLAFDHAEMLGMAVTRLRGRLFYSPIAYELVGKVFTLRALQSVFEAILGHPVNKDAFRRRILASGQVKATGNLETLVTHRPAELYRFTPADAP